MDNETCCKYVTRRELESFGIKQSRLERQTIHIDYSYSYMVAERGCNVRRNIDQRIVIHHQVKWK